jgi:hypothetical protein
MHKKQTLLLITGLALIIHWTVIPGLGRAEDDTRKHDQLTEEIKQLQLEKEILEKKLQEVQTLLDMEDPANPDIYHKDDQARKTLARMAKATERFAKANAGVYPNQMSQLTDIFPPYIKNNYCNQELAGFRFSCHMSPNGFKYTATPLTLGKTGSKILSVTTGGSFFAK